MDRHEFTHVETALLDAHARVERRLGLIQWAHERSVWRFGDTVCPDEALQEAFAQFWDLAQAGRIPEYWLLDGRVNADYVSIWLETRTRRILRDQVKSLDGWCEKLGSDVRLDEPVPGRDRSSGGDGAVPTRGDLLPSRDRTPEDKASDRSSFTSLLAIVRQHGGKELAAAALFDLESDEVGRLGGVSPAAARKRMSRARTALKKALAEPAEGRAPSQPA